MPNVELLLFQIINRKYNYCYAVTRTLFYRFETGRYFHQKHRHRDLLLIEHFIARFFRYGIVQENAGLSLQIFSFTMRSKNFKKKRTNFNLKHEVLENFDEVYKLEDINWLNIFVEVFSSLYVVPLVLQIFKIPYIALSS